MSSFGSFQTINIDAGDYRIAGRIDAKQVTSEVNALLEKKCRGITTNNELYGNIAETYLVITFSNNLVPKDTGALQEGNYYDSKNKRFVASSVKGGAEREYAGAQWIGVGWGGKKIKKENRANKNATTKWLIRVWTRGNLKAEFLNDVKDEIIKFMQKGKI